MRFPRLRTIVVILTATTILVGLRQPYRKGMTFLAGGAAVAHKPQLLSLILTAGGDANGRFPDKSWHWTSPLIFLPLWAKAPEAADSLRILLAHGADANARDVNGRTPLMAAPEFFGAKEINVLLHAGADPNLEDRDGNTALHYASGNAGDWPKQVQLLLDAGADPCHRNHKGQFVIEAASGEFPLAKSLLETCRGKAAAR